MRVPCHMAAIRAATDMSLADVKELIGIERGTLSRIERGCQLPADDQVAKLELAYGPMETWWPADVRTLLQFDREGV